MSTDRLAEIKARAEKATMGPWGPYDNYVVIPGVGAVEFETGNPFVGDSSHDTHFVAHAREDVPYLLARVAALEAELSRIQQLARCFRLEDLLDNPNDTSETVRTLRAFEVAASLRRQLVKAEAERDTRLTPAQVRERIEARVRHEGYVHLDDVLALFPDQEEKK